MYLFRGRSLPVRYQPPAKKQPDLMALWRSLAPTHPVLAAISRRIHGTPTTSVPYERLFCTAGVIVNDLRRSLLPQTVSKLVFLNKNSDLY